MNKGKQRLYTTPQVEVIETPVQGVIFAASIPNGTDSYEREEWN